MKLFFAGFGIVVALLWGVAVFNTPKPFEQKTVIYWSTDPNPARKDQIAPFELANPDIKVVVEPNSFERTIVQCSTGIGPDLIEIYSVGDMVAYAEAGILMDLTPYKETRAFGLESTYPRLWGALTYEERQYRYPANAASQVLFYNKRMFREAGIPEPTDSMDWDAFIEMAKPLTKRRASGVGYTQFAMVLGRDFVRDVHLQHGGKFFNETKTRCIVDSPESIRAIQFYKDLMTIHEIIPTPDAATSLSGEGGWGSGEIRWFAAGKAAMIWGSRWMIVQFRQYPDMYPDLGCVLLPASPYGAPTSYAGARGPAINVNTRNLEASLKFMEYLASDDYSEIIAMSGDALPPNRSYSAEPARLLNPRFPNETYQEKFLVSMENAVSQEVSPFVSPKVVDRIWIETMQKVENNLAQPEQAMREAASRINDAIAQNLREQPELRQRYEALLNAPTPGG